MLKRIISILICLTIGLSLIAQSPKGKYVKFLKTTISDNEAGMPLGTFLVPEGWKFFSQINWTMQSPAYPAKVSAKFYDPQTIEACEFFPIHDYFWTNNQMTMGFFPPGSRYMGSEVRAPRPLAEIMQKVIIPQYRGQYQDIRIVSSERIPMEVQGSPQTLGMRVSREGIQMKIEYTHNGIPLEEEFYAVMDIMSTQPDYSGIYIQNWSISYLTSFKTRKGQLTKSKRVLQTIKDSFVMNPQWFNTYSQVVNMLLKMKQEEIAAAGRMSRIISQTNREINDMIMKSYNERQKVNDDMAHKFNQMIRGVETWETQGREGVELPSGYENAWTNGLGDYIISEEVDFDPNRYFQQSWEELKRRD